jgi:hypothetical protein
MLNFSAPPSTLKEYSPWMSSFQASNYDDQLEIPGKYKDFIEVDSDCKALYMFDYFRRRRELRH